MFARLYLEVLLHYLIGFLVQAPHYVDTKSLGHVASPTLACHLPEGHGDPGALLTQSFLPTFLIFSRNLHFPVESRYFFHIFLSVKSSEVLSKYIFWQNFSNQFHVRSWRWILWEGKRASLALTKVLQLQCYPRQEGLELVGVYQEKKGWEKTQQFAV